MEKFELYKLNIGNFWDPIDDKNFWEAIIEIPNMYSLFDPHLYIQHIIHFDNDHLFEFYAGRNDRNRKIAFSDNLGYPHDGGDYESILLKDIYPLKGYQLREVSAPYNALFGAKKGDMDQKNTCFGGVNIE